VHVRNKHTTEVDVKFEDDIATTKLIRNPITFKFDCTCGRYSNADPSNLRRHAQRHKNVHNPVLDLPLNPASSHDPSIDPNLPMPMDVDCSLIDPDQDLGVHELDRVDSALGNPDQDLGNYELDRIHSSTVNVASHTPPNTIPALTAENVNSGRVASELVVDPDLDKIGFVANTKFHILICESCSAAIFPCHVPAHLLSHHIPCPDSALLTSLVEKYAIAPATVTMPPGLHPPVKGLSVYDGFQCQECGHCTSQESSMKKHVSQHAEGPIESIPCNVQTFFLGRHRRFFRVEPSLSSVDDGITKSNFHLFLESLTPPTNPPASPITPPNDNRELSPFLLRSSWHLHIEGHLPADLIHLASFPNKEEAQLVPLKNVVLDYMLSVDNDIVEGLKSGKTLILRWINSTKL
jgi:Orsellinic acid/F9775 biosynthesis cluster protein D